MDEFLSGKDYLTSALLVGGSAASAIGTVFATMTAEGIGGLFITGGGILLAGYGVYNMGRDRTLRAALKREEEANERLDDALVKLAECRRRNIRLRAGLPEDDDDAPTVHPNSGPV